MKYLCFLCILLCFACRGTRFHLYSDARVEHLGELTPVTIDSTYSLYLRKVIAEFDSTINKYIPKNAKPADDKSRILEVEYLLYSPAYQRVIVITNVPNSYAKFYNSADKRSDLSFAADTTPIDIWYFRQFRFGSADDGFSKILFRQIQGSNDDHRWTLDTHEDSLYITRVAKLDSFGENVVNVERALTLPILFVKMPAFRLVFKDNFGKSKKTTGVPETPLPNQTFYIAGNASNKIVFRFLKTLRGEDKKNVVFDGNRLYSGWRGMTLRIEDKN